MRKSKTFTVRKSKTFTVRKSKTFKGEEVTCKEVYVFHAFYGKLHCRFHQREEVDQAENAEQCGSKSGLSFAVKTVETVTVHSEVYFPFFCSKFRYFTQIFFKRDGEEWPRLETLF